MTTTPDTHSAPVSQATYDDLVARLDQLRAEVDTGARTRDNVTYSQYRLCVDELAAKWPEYTTGDGPA